MSARTPFSSSRFFRLTWFGLLNMALAGLPPLWPLAAASASGIPEVRALWVARTSLASPASVAEMVRAAKASGFNTLLVQVRARGDAYFNGGIEPRAAALAGAPATFDPLQVALKQAHDAGLRVHAWVNVDLVSSASDLPTSRAHVIYRHPEWVMVPREVAREMALLDPHTPLYLDKLARAVRSHASGVEGLYLSPIPREAADYTVAVVTDIVRRYAVDGVHLDYVRYPNEEFDYSQAALGEFAAALDEGQPGGTLDSGGPRADLLARTQAFADHWRAFRRARLTALIARLHDAITRHRPGALVTAAVVPDPEAASASRLQDWRAWLEDGLIDVVCPMAYATDAAQFTAQITSVKEAAADHPVWAGIGAYRLSSLQTVENIQIARRLGASGVILFSYDSLTTPPRGAEYLSEVGRAAFGQ
jgi:uncharacterized lipoprotein YddW (UPF0748 family)